MCQLKHLAAGAVTVLVIMTSAPAVAQEVSSTRLELRTVLLYDDPSPHSAAAPLRIGFDKVQHFTFSFLWTLGSQYALVNKASLSERQALPASVTSAAAAGLLKEVYDWRYKSTSFSTADLLANGLGIACAVGVILF